MFLAGDKVDVIHQQQVLVPVFLAEGVGVPQADGLRQLVGELVALDVDDLIVRMLLLDGVVDGVEKMGFTQAGLSIEEERVVALSRSSATATAAL